MKILTIISSYRKNGNTSKIVRQIEDQLRIEADQRGLPLELETVYLGHQHLELCRGCRVCFDRGEAFCPLKDDLLSIKAKIQAADGLIVASPVYVGDVNGIMKNWIDRMAHVCHRPEFADKCVYLITSTGHSPTKHTLTTLQSAFISWGAYLVGWQGFKMGARMDAETAKELYQEHCRKIARKLLHAIQTRSYTKPPVYSLMVFKIQQWNYIRTRKDTLDYQYWHNQGWTQPAREFFIPHQANRLTVRIARWVGTILAVLWA